MRRALYVSTGIHVALLLWIAVGDSLFRKTPEVDFEVTGVTLLSTSDFDALFSSAPAAVSVETPAAPLAVPEVEALVVPLAEAEPTVTQPTPEASQAEPETPPDVTELTTPPVTDVTDELAGLPSPPAQDLQAPISESPTPREAPRVAPTPAPAPAPDVEIAPDVVAEPKPSETETALPIEEPTPTAPEEATTEIVTEAEVPARSIAPTSSVRPTARPPRPTPAPAETVADTVPETTPEAVPEVTAEAPAATEDAVASAIAAAVSEAATPAPASNLPVGPPLTQGEREGLRVAVQECWNVGSLSSDALATTIIVSVQMSQDGRPETSSIRMIGSEGGSDAAARQAFEAARRAIIRCGASGYNLPSDKYDQWRDIEMTFNPEGMRLR
jgi:hypothetical protein